MTTTKETMMDWLRDAHAMEGSIATMLEKQAKKLEDNPTVRSKIEEHLELTRSQEERVKTLIENMGGNPSRVKDTTGKILTNVQAMVSSNAPDAVVKNTIANFAVEHFEIASYRSLIAAAEDLGETEVVRVCQDILREEEEMADWLEAQIPRVTTGYLQKKATQQA